MKYFKFLDDTERARLNDTIDKILEPEKIYIHRNHINGGYAHATLDAYDFNYFYLTISCGTSGEEGSDRHESHIRVTRKNHVVKNMRKSPRFKPFSISELTRISDKMNEMVAPEFRIYRKLSGGFAEANIFDYGDDNLLIDISYGVISDCRNEIYTERYELDRDTLEEI